MAGESTGFGGATESGAFGGSAGGAMAAYRAGEMGNPAYASSMSPGATMSGYSGWEGVPTDRKWTPSDDERLRQGLQGIGGGRHGGAPGSGGSGGGDFGGTGVRKLGRLTISDEQIRAIVALVGGLLAQPGIMSGLTGAKK